MFSTSFCLNVSEPRLGDDDLGFFKKKMFLALLSQPTFLHLCTFWSCKTQGLPSRIVSATRILQLRYSKGSILQLWIQICPAFRIVNLRVNFPGCNDYNGYTWLHGYRSPLLDFLGLFPRPPPTRSACGSVAHSRQPGESAFRMRISSGYVRPCHVTIYLHDSKCRKL